MSPLWRDEVRLHLGPQGASLARYRRGLKPQLVLEKVVVAAEGGAGDWSRSLSAARSELEAGEWRHANASVVVSDAWVRYAVVPWRHELTDDTERLAHGRLILRQAYGDEMAGWTMQLGQTVPGLAQLVCAIPTVLLADIRAALQQSALRMTSLQPRLVAAFNRWRSRMPESGGWFVAVDDGALAAARLDGEQWADVHCIRVDGDWIADLNRLRTVDLLENGAASPRRRVLIDAPAHLRRFEAGVRHGFEWLDDEAPAGDRLSRRVRLPGSRP